MRGKILSCGLAVVVAVAFGLAGCERTTGELSPELLARFEKEGIAQRADDLTFRRTKVGERQGAGWDEKQASLIVTKESVFLHENGKAMVEITPRSTGYYKVQRERDRISLRAGSGQSALSWSFRPPAAAEQWALDIRAVIKNSRAREEE